MSLPEFRTILRQVLSIVTYNTMFYIKRQTRGHTDVQVIPEVLTDSINRITIFKQQQTTEITHIFMGKGTGTRM